MNMENEKAEINILINKMAALCEYLNDYLQIHEKDLNKFLIEQGYKSLYDKKLIISEYHVIDCIGKNHLPNVTFISKKLDMTKGAISKITTKLLVKGLIKENRLTGNKKEIYYTLTSLGRTAYEIHEKFHDMENEKFINVLEKYTEKELRTINSFADDFLNELSKEI